MLELKPSGVLSSSWRQSLLTFEAARTASRGFSGPTSGHEAPAIEADHRVSLFLILATDKSLICVISHGLFHHQGCRGSD